MTHPIDPPGSSSGVRPGASRAPARFRASARPGIVSAAMIGLVILSVAVVRTRSSNDPDALLQRAQDQFRDGRHDRASGLLDRLASIRQPTPLDRLLRAQVSLATDQPARALDELSRIPDEHPVAPLSRLLRGRAAMQLGRVPEATSSFLKAVELQPRHVQARRELTFIYGIQRRLPELDEQLAALSGLGELPPSYVLHWSKIRNVNWNYEKDLDNLRRFVAGDPNDRHSRLTLAEAIRRSGQPDEAEEILGPLPEADPEAVALRARLAIDRGDLSRAEAVLVGASIDHPAVAAIRGELALLRGDPEAALPLLRAAERHDPTSRMANFHLGQALTKLGDPEAAKPYLDRVRRNDMLGQLISRASTLPDLDDPDLCTQIGQECLALGRPLEARAWLNTALSVDPFHDGAQRIIAGLEDVADAPAVQSTAHNAF